MEYAVIDMRNVLKLILSHEILITGITNVHLLLRYDPMKHGEKSAFRPINHWRTHI